MFEYHGWATLRTDVIDEYGIEDEKSLQEFLSQLRQYTKIAPISGLVHVEVQNGHHALSVFGSSNHRQEGVTDLFKWLAENGRASYGLLYIRDDEDSERGDNYTNQFRVWRLALGKLEELDDLFLSPCIPMVELPF